MGIYERLGAKPLINVCGAMTRYGGALMEQEVLEAMDEAATQCVRLDELEAAASKVIAEITHTQAGIVTAGAYAALTLGTAACITGFDVYKMNRLPDTMGMPNEVIMPWHQISGYDHAIRAAGAKLVGAGIPDTTAPPQEVRTIYSWHIESAINENTAAIAYAPRIGSHPPLEKVVEIGKKYNIPVIVDAAAQVPPLENLHKYADIGVDLIAISGGKGIRGPQASGILCGRADLIASAVVQTLDMGGILFDEWNPPASLIPKERFRGMPEHGIARGAKVTKEAIVGLVVALQNLTEEKFARKTEHLRELLWNIGNRIGNIVGVELRMSEECLGGYPMLEIKIDEKMAGRNAYEVCFKLRDEGIHVRDKALQKGLIVIHSINIDEDTARIVGERLYAAITG